METMTIPTSVMESELIQFIKKQPESTIQYMYQMYILSPQKNGVDGWDLMTDEDREDIEVSLQEIERGEFVDAKEFLKEFRHGRK